MPSITPLANCAKRLTLLPQLTFARDDDRGGVLELLTEVRELGEAEFFSADVGSRRVEHRGMNAPLIQRGEALDIAAGGKKFNVGLPIPTFLTSRCVRSVGEPPKLPTPINFPLRSLGFFISWTVITESVNELSSPIMIVGSAPSMRARTGPFRTGSQPLYLPPK